MASPQVTPQIKWDDTPASASQIKWDDEPKPSNSHSLIDSARASFRAKGGNVEMPGSFEGHPENMADYVDASAGEVARGAGDMAQGRMARGAHRMISGTMAGVEPAVGFIPFNPRNLGRLALSAGTGAVGRKVAEAGAEGFGAGDDTKALTGDIGGVAGGAFGAKVPLSRSGIADTLDLAADNADLLNPINLARRGAKGLANVIRPKTAEAPPVSSAPYPSARPGDIPREVIRPRALLPETTPVEGEYLPPEPPKALSAGFRRPLEVNAQFPAPEVSPAPYRFGPGEIAPEDVNTPDPFTLGRRQGVRVQPSGSQRSLPAAPPEAEPFGVNRSEAIPTGVDSDTDFQSIMREDLENHGARARREQNAQFREGNDVAVPKWKMQAQAKADMAAQQILQEAERTHNNPLAGLPPVTSRVKAAPASELPVSTPDSEILSKLKESVKKAKSEKKK